MRPGVLTAVYGRSRTGKGQWVCEQLRHKKVALVWDLKANREEYNKEDDFAVRVFDIATLARVVARVKSGLVVYSGTEKDLESFIKIAWLFAEKFRDRCAVVLDETSDITGSGKAAGAYGGFLRRSLYLGHDVYVMCQRAAESDKTAPGNAMRFHFSALGTPRDRESMADATGVPLAVIEQVKAFFHPSDNRLSWFDCVTVDKDHSYQKARLEFKTGKRKFRLIGKKISFS
jgi:hypothetical protein